MSSVLLLIGQVFGYEPDSPTPVCASTTAPASIDDDPCLDDALLKKITSIVAEAQKELDKCKNQALAEKCAFRPDQLANILVEFQNAMEEKAFAKTTTDDQHRVMTDLTQTAMTLYQFEAQQLSKNYLRALEAKRNSINESTIEINALEHLTARQNVELKDLNAKAKTLSSTTLSKIRTAFEASNKFRQIEQELENFEQTLQVLKVILLVQLSHSDAGKSPNQSSDPFRKAVVTMKAIQTEIATKALGLSDLKKLEEEKS